MNKSVDTYNSIDLKEKYSVHDSNYYKLFIKEYSSCDFRQYYKHTKLRYDHMKDRITSELLLKNKNISIADKICYLKNGENIGLVGVISKFVQNRPNIINDTDIIYKNQFEKSYNNVDEDKLFIEDATGRVILKFNDDVRNLKKVLVSGIPIGIIGSFTEKNGDFIVKDVCFCYTSVLTQIEEFKNTMHYTDNKLPGYLAIISEPNIGLSVDADKALERILCRLNNNHNYNINKDNIPTIDNIYNNTIRFIIAGGTIQPTDFHLVDNLCYSNTEFNDNIIEKFEKNAEVADKFLCKLNTKVCTSILPCYYELTSSIYPHVNIPSYFFKDSFKQTKNFNCLTNPCIFKVNNKIILGCSGENILSFKLNSFIEDDLLIASLLLEMGHLAPTCPDMLRTFSFTSKDPFILDEENETMPDVLYIGQCSKFQTALYEFRGKKTTKLIRIICVPKFVENKSVVFLNLDTLEIIEHKYK